MRFLSIILVGLSAIILAPGTAPAAAPEAPPLITFAIVPVDAPETSGEGADATCGGNAPFSTSCSGSFSPACSTVYVSLEPALGYTGPLRNQGGTSTFSYTYSATFVGGAIHTPPSLTTSGGWYCGQIFSFSGSASGVGQWAVGLRN